MNKTLSIVVFLAVIAVLVFITINKKEEESMKVTENTAGLDTNTMDTNINNEETSPEAPATSGAEVKPVTKQLAGVKITTLKEGTGAAAKAGDTVAMNYTGVLVDGTVFDSNVDPKFNHVEPFVFTLGAGQVIKGWDVGVDGMKVGEKRKLEIEASYAYGASGAGGVIPPNANLIFEVELLAIK